MAQTDHIAYLDHNETAKGCAVHDLHTEKTVFGMAQSVHIRAPRWLKQRVREAMFALAQSLTDCCYEVALRI